MSVFTKRAWRCIVASVAVTVSLIAAGAGTAEASKWSPNAVSVAAIGTRFEFSAELSLGVVTTTTCSAFVITGTTGTPNASEWTAVPHPSRCSVASNSAGTFKAVAVFAGGNPLASFVINAGGSLGFTLTPGCLIKIVPQTISQNRNYSPGADGLVDPAVWRFDHQSVSINYPGGCASTGTTTGTINGVFAMINRSNAANPIEVEA